MAEPATIAAIVIAAVKVGLDIWQTISGQKAIEAEKAAMQAQANFEARQAKKAAFEIGQIGVKKEATLVQEGEQFRGYQISQASGSGVKLDTGTNADLIQDTDRSIAADVNELRTNYANERNRLLREAKYLKKSGRPLGRQYDAQAMSARLKGYGSILTSASTLADRWSSYQTDTATTG